MRLIMLLGAADGEVFKWHESAAPATFRVPLRGTADISVNDWGEITRGPLYVEYRLISLDPQEAFYAPSGYSPFRVIKELATR